MFQKASRLKLRFGSNKGGLTVEDLWDLPLATKDGRPCLDNIAKDLFRKIKDGGIESFVLKSKAPDEVLQLKFNIVKHIIDVRLAEAEKAEQAIAIKEKKQKILAAIAEKETQSLREADLEELKKMLAEL